MACLIDFKCQFANKNTHVYLCVEMSSQTTSLTPKKAAERGRKPKSNSPSDFCGMCVVFLLFAWGILVRRHTYLWRIYSQACIRRTPSGPMLVSA